MDNNFKRPTKYTKQVGYSTDLFTEDKKGQKTPLPILCGYFKRGTPYQVTKVTEDNFKTILGYTPQNPHYKVLANFFQSGVKEIAVICLGEYVPYTTNQEVGNSCSSEQFVILRNKYNSIWQADSAPIVKIFRDAEKTDLIETIDVTTSKKTIIYDNSEFGKPLNQEIFKFPLIDTTLLKKYGVTVSAIPIVSGGEESNEEMPTEILIKFKNLTTSPVFFTFYIGKPFLLYGEETEFKDYIDGGTPCISLDNRQTVNVSLGGDANGVADGNTVPDWVYEGEDSDSDSDSDSDNDDTDNDDDSNNDNDSSQKPFQCTPLNLIIPQMTIPPVDGNYTFSYQINNEAVKTVEIGYYSNGTVSAVTGMQNLLSELMTTETGLPIVTRRASKGSNSVSKVNPFSTYYETNIVEGGSASDPNVRKIEETRFKLLLTDGAENDLIKTIWGESVEMISCAWVAWGQA